MDVSSCLDITFAVQCVWRGGLSDRLATPSTLFIDHLLFRIVASEGPHLLDPLDFV